MWGYEGPSVGEEKFYKPLDSGAVKNVNTYPEYMYSLFVSELIVYSSRVKEALWNNLPPCGLLVSLRNDAISGLNVYLCFWQTRHLGQ